MVVELRQFYGKAADRLMVAFTLPNDALTSAVMRGVEQVEQRLYQVLQFDGRFATEAARHLLEAGGKRLRPMLTVLCSHLGSGPNDQVIDAGAVVELTHLASLYHDDVMDSAPLRRGQPAAHQVYGPTVAILTGDLLLAKASQMVAMLGTEVSLIQATTLERLCLGQIFETSGPAEADPVAFHMQVLADKTGALIATSARFGALLAGCSDQVVQALVGFGEAVGVAFQLADDIIDLTGPAAKTGKTPGTDLREQVPTMPQLLVEQAATNDHLAGLAKSESIDLAQRFNQDLSDDAVLAEVVTRLQTHPAMDQARALARQWAAKAKAELAPIPDGEVEQALATIADLFVDRMA
ncbi:MAG: polyprenyl synthetase family protein [Micrococcales bacterium]|nr:polyprenyl synthetase family protein [Micrococcales bacterium]